MMVFKDDAQIYDLLFVLMANFDDEEDGKVTIEDNKENNKYYSHKEFRYLDTIFIDSLCELTKQ